MRKRDYGKATVPCPGGCPADVTVRFERTGEMRALCSCTCIEHAGRQGRDVLDAYLAKCEAAALEYLENRL